jgi:predicted Zn-dependent protease with MMP-like domain
MNRIGPYAELPAPSLDDIAALARQAFDALPDPFRKLAGDVVFRVEDFAEPEVLAEVGVDDPFELTGLYQGVALSQRSVLSSGTPASMVFLYRRPILDYWCESGEDLPHIVRHVLIHEIGHHFGFSDEDMEALEAETD